MAEHGKAAEDGDTQLSAHSAAKCGRVRKTAECDREQQIHSRARTVRQSAATCAERSKAAQQSHARAPHICIEHTVSDDDEPLNPKKR